MPTRLIFLTDVPGVKDAEGCVIPWLNTQRCGGSGRTLSDWRRDAAETRAPVTKRSERAWAGCGIRLPAAQAEILPQFYFTKLEYGTEVIGA